MLGLPADIEVADTMAVEAAETFFHTALIASELERPHPLFPSVSFIIPTLNEEQNIADLLVRIDVMCQQHHIAYEVIIVDDHSSDATQAVAARVALSHKFPVHILTKQGKQGKSYSLIEGFEHARFDVLGMIDGDLQYPPEALPEMLAELAHAHIVVGDRRTTYRQSAKMRGVLSAAFSEMISRRVFGIDTDIQSGLKVFFRDVYANIELNPGPWSFDLDLVTKAAHAGYTIANVPITLAPRLAGKSKVSAVAVGSELLLATSRLSFGLNGQNLLYVLMRFGIFPRTEGYLAREAQRLPCIPEPDPHLAEIDYYATWLHEETSLAKNRYGDALLQQYIDDAVTPMTFHGTTVNTFTPLKRVQSAMQTFTRGQTITLTLLAVLWLVGLFVAPLLTLVVSLAAVVVIYLRNMIQTFALVTQMLDASPDEEIDDAIVHALRNAPWPRYTILCPLYKEAEVVPQFVRAMAALDYPANRLQILLLTEANDSVTRDAILALNLPRHFEIVTVPAGNPQTKPRACNFGLLQADGAFTVIFDAEDVPDPLQLKKAVLTFANHGADLACVQAKLNFYNPNQNLLTRWFTIEYTLWFELLLPGMQRAGMSLPLGGTSNHFRTGLLRKLGAWDPFNVTEDCDLGLRLAQHHMHTVVLNSTTMEEANSVLSNWIRQRSRWIKGYLQTYLVHMREPFRYFRRKRFKEFTSLQFVIGGTPATFFINPLMWLMLGLYVFARPYVESAYHSLYPAPLFYASALCLVFGNFLYLFISLLACAKRGQYGLMWWALLIPIYWAMMSIAAIVAVAQLLYKPHYWEKTQHGLHLRSHRGGNPDTLFATSKVQPGIGMEE